MIRIKLSRILGDKRISQATLAKRTGLRTATINIWYNEIIDRISLEHLDRICEALDCSPGELLEFEPNAIKKTGKNPLLEEHGNRRKKTD